MGGSYARASSKELVERGHFEPREWPEPLLQPIRAAAGHTKRAETPAVGLYGGLTSDVGASVSQSSRDYRRRSADYGRRAHSLDDPRLAYL